MEIIISCAKFRGLIVFGLYFKACRVVLWMKGPILKGLHPKYNVHYTQAILVVSVELLFQELCSDLFI
jgi:hypothetical protein